MPFSLRITNLHSNTLAAPINANVEVHDTADGYRTIIAWNSPDDEGPSVTNAAEDLWTEIQARAGWPAKRLRFVEYYPQRGALEPTYDEVTFSGVVDVVSAFRSYKLTRPKWTHLGNDSWAMAMLGNIPGTLVEPPEHPFPKRRPGESPMEFTGRALGERRDV